MSRIDPRLDRLAFQNMTSKGRGSLCQSGENEVLSSAPESSPPVDSVQSAQKAYFENVYNRGSASLDSFCQPTGELTSKSKMNGQMNTYYMERQSKNQGNYNTFVSALNNNIQEDRQRTDLNNNYLQSESRPADNFERVYHPGLGVASDPNDSELIGIDRNSLTTRDRRENSLAKNKNSSHLPSEISTQSNGIPQPPPKLNYPHGYGDLTPLEMDMRSHIDTQFQTLTDIDMERQINSLQGQAKKSTGQISQGQTPMDRQTYFHAQNTSQYNPHADHLNGQLSQMSRHMPEHRSSSNQFQDMTAMYNLGHLQQIPQADVVGFQRPSSSNLKANLQPNQGQYPQQVQYPSQPMQSQPMQSQPMQSQPMQSQPMQQSSGQYWPTS
jgi:hypothetical protein